MVGPLLRYTSPQAALCVDVLSPFYEFRRQRLVRPQNPQMVIRVALLRRNFNVVPFAFDRRLEPRRSAQHIGKILTEPTAPPEYCLVTVTETSKGGARICTAIDIIVPSVFTLRFDKTEAKYKVIWRQGAVYWRRTSILSGLLLAARRFPPPWSGPRNRQFLERSVTSRMLS
jgi:hypothetical protein